MFKVMKNVGDLVGGGGWAVIGDHRSPITDYLFPSKYPPKKHRISKYLARPVPFSPEVGIIH
jgi:hypothetical protein